MTVALRAAGPVCLNAALGRCAVILGGRRVWVVYNVRPTFCIDNGNADVPQGRCRAHVRTSTRARSRRDACKWHPMQASGCTKSSKVCTAAPYQAGLGGRVCISHWGTGCHEDPVSVPLGTSGCAHCLGVSGGNCLHCPQSPGGGEGVSKRGSDDPHAPSPPSSRCERGGRGGFRKTGSECQTLGFPLALVRNGIVRKMRVNRIGLDFV